MSIVKNWFGWNKLVNTFAHTKTIEIQKEQLDGMGLGKKETKISVMKMPRLSLSEKWIKGNQIWTTQTNTISNNARDTSIHHTTPQTKSGTCMRGTAWLVMKNKHFKTTLQSPIIHCDASRCGLQSFKSRWYSQISTYIGQYIGQISVSVSWKTGTYLAYQPVFKSLVVWAVEERCVLSLSYYLRLLRRMV